MDNCVNPPSEGHGEAECPANNSQLCITPVPTTKKPRTNGYVNMDSSENVGDRRLQGGSDSSTRDIPCTSSVSSDPPSKGKKQNKNNQDRPHHYTCCDNPRLCALYGPPTLIKPVHYNRLLSTNPVCLLTTLSPPPALPSSSSQQVQKCSNPTSQHDEISNLSHDVSSLNIALPQSSPSLDLTQSTPSLSSSSSSSSSSIISSSLHPNSYYNNIVPRHPNIMTISWLTPTDNDGNIFLSMNADRYTAQNIRQSGRFVLNIPIHGMENTVRNIGKVSGRLYHNNNNIEQTTTDSISINNDTNVTQNIPNKDNNTGDIPRNKFEALGINLSYPCWSDQQQVYPPPVPKSKKISTSSSSSLELSTPLLQLNPLPPSILASTLVKRHYKGSDRQTVDALTTNLATSIQYNDIILSDCIAHIVCTIQGIIEPLRSDRDATMTPMTPLTTVEDSNQISSLPHQYNRIGTPGHLNIFAHIQYCVIRRNYFNNGLFMPLYKSIYDINTIQKIPPMLTFAGNGIFMYPISCYNDRLYEKSQHSDDDNQNE